VRETEAPHSDRIANGLVLSVCLTPEAQSADAQQSRAEVIQAKQVVGRIAGHLHLHGDRAATGALKIEIAEGLAVRLTQERNITGLIRKLASAVR
jgi:hypothetical protein